MKSTACIILLLIAFCGINKAQIANGSISFFDEKKEMYHIGDTIKILIKITIPPEICSDGMEKAKTYLSGLEIISQSEWQEKNRLMWGKQMTLMVSQNKKRQGKITVLRKADKGEFFIQEKINIAEE